MFVTSLSLLLLICIIICLAEEAGKPEWGYNGDTIPERWPAIYAKCGGQNQSPINIDKDRVVVNPKLPPIKFVGYNTPLSDVEISNTGHTIAIAPPPKSNILIQAGGLKGRYKLQQCHFHWGINNMQGSEHTINGKRFPLEAHCVHMNVKYANMTEALKNKDGLAVIAILYKLSSRTNAALNVITSSINQVRRATQKEVIHFGYPLSRLLPRNRNSYIRYFGSLTTPECNEVVTWTVFTEKQRVLTTQMALFRLVVETPPNSKEEVYLATNYRPVQSLNGRVIQGSRNYHR